MLPGLTFPDVRDASVRDIWLDSTGFTHFRGVAANTDPVCDLSPNHHLVTEAVASAGRPRSITQRVVEKPLVFRSPGNSVRLFS